MKEKKITEELSLLAKVRLKAAQTMPRAL